MSNINSLELRCSLQRALLYNITPSMRCIFVDISDPNNLILWVYFDKEPTDLELDLIDSAALEVCGDFQGLDDLEVKCTVSEKKFHELGDLKMVVYGRYEE